MSLDRDDVTAVVADSVGWVWLEESSIQNSTNWLPWISLMLCKMQQAVITLGTCWSSISFCFINRLHLAFRWLNPLLCVHVITDSWIFSLHLSSQNFEERFHQPRPQALRKGESDKGVERIESSGEREPGLYCFAVYTFHCVAIVIMTIFLFLLRCCYCSDVMYERARSGVLTCWPACRHVCKARLCNFVVAVQLFSKAVVWVRWGENKPVSRALLGWLASVLFYDQG